MGDAPSQLLAQQDRVNATASLQNLQKSVKKNVCFVSFLFLAFLICTWNLNFEGIFQQHSGYQFVFTFCPKTNHIGLSKWEKLHVQLLAVSSTDQHPLYSLS